MSNKVHRLIPRDRAPVTFDHLPDLRCPECRGERFVRVLRFKAISHLISQSGKTEIAEGVGPVQCIECGAINDVEKLILVFASEEEAKA